MKIKKLSIIIPVYNEKNTVDYILDRVKKTNLGEVEKEVIIIDDGSGDGTRNILKKYENVYKVVYHSQNKGKGAAVRSGFEEATGDYIVVQDADLEYDPNDFRQMIEKAEKDSAEVVYGSRRLGKVKKKNPMAGWQYYFGGVLLSYLTNFLYGTNITDEPTCYKMFNRSLLDKFKLQSNGFEFCPELTAKIARLKIKIHEVPISYSPRSKKEGKKIKLRDGLTAVWTLIKYRFLS